MVPKYIISAGAMTADSTDARKSSLPVGLRVDLRLNQINTAEISLSWKPSEPVKIGDAVTIQLGQVDEGTKKVFTGIVTELSHQTAGYVIHCSSGLQALTLRCVNKSYEQQKAGDIVSDIASIAKCKKGKVSGGLSYPSYAIGAERHLLSHLLTLAARDGFDVYADADDRLCYTAFSGSPTHRLGYGAEIISYFSEEQAATLDGVEVYGESPASLGQGDKAYSWLTKGEVRGRAGKGSGNLLRVADPSIRNQSAAGTAAERIFATLGSARKGHVNAMGTPGPVLGGAIAMAGLPDGGPSGSFKITGIKHTLDKQNGFITTVDWRKA
ncbi:MAG: hypothetical protein RLZZ165_166 [Bacteroidota bacterium]|jgi:phage protein D